MSNSLDLNFDVASAISQGQRDFQEDALICDFPIGSDLGFAVLSDGMGGHAAGDIASKIVVTEVFAELKLQSGDLSEMELCMSDILQGAAKSANECIGAHASDNPTLRGMGATLIAPVLMHNRLYWVSVGDSPLYLFRDGELKQLNQDHSMAPQIDFLVRTGKMESETASNHPDRQCLTSVLAGRNIARIDCPTEPVNLQVGDIVIAASDGLQFLDNETISGVLNDHSDDPAAHISNQLLRQLTDLGDPDQDNISFCVIRVLDDLQATGTIAAAETRAVKSNVTILATKSGQTRVAVMYKQSSECSA